MFSSLSAGPSHIFLNVWPGLSGVLNRSGLLDRSHICEPMPKLSSNSSSKSLRSAVPGEKQSVIPFRSSGTRYAPSNSPPMRMSGNGQGFGFRNSTMSSADFTSSLIFLKRIRASSRLPFSKWNYNSFGVCCCDTATPQQPFRPVPVLATEITASVIWIDLLAK